MAVQLQIQDRKASYIKYLCFSGKIPDSPFHPDTLLLLSEIMMEHLHTQSFLLSFSLPLLTSGSRMLHPELQDNRFSLLELKEIC